MKSFNVPEVSGVSNSLMGGFDELPDKIRFKVSPSIVNGPGQIIRTLVFFENNLQGDAQCAHMVTGCKTCESDGFAPIQYAFVEPYQLNQDVFEAVYREKSKHELASYAGGLILSLPIDVESPFSVYNRGLSEYSKSKQDTSNIVSIESARSSSEDFDFRNQFSAVAGQ